ncbi:MAG TPA: iron ABC transporter permease [Bacteroidia bacterium]|nr:iron ABC transporter permease [Bacteroidia bacterium]
MKYFSNTYFLLSILILLSIANLLSGSINIFKTSDVQTLLLELRLPKVLTGIATGSIIAICGLILQILFRNPLAGPYVLGISSASSLFTSIGIMGTGLITYPLIYHLQLNLLSISGALVGLMIILLMLQITSQIIIILLVGFMLSQLYSAIQSILTYLSTEHALKLFTLWTMGNIQNTNLIQSLILFGISIISLIIILRYSKPLSIYITGDESAKVMGIDIEKIKKNLIIITAVLIGIITAYCGPIAFVGMSIPILVRILNKNANIYQWIQHTFLYGSISIILTDLINQWIFNGSMPLNVLISIWGVPLLIWILIKQMKFLI